MLLPSWRAATNPLFCGVVIVAGFTSVPAAICAVASQFPGALPHPICWLIFVALTGLLLAGVVSPISPGRVRIRTQAVSSSWSAEIIWWLARRGSPSVSCERRVLVSASRSRLDNWLKDLFAAFIYLFASSGRHRRDVFYLP